MKKFILFLALMIGAGFLMAPSFNGWRQGETIFLNSTSPVPGFVADTWVSGIISSTTPVTFFTAPAGTYYHILKVILTPLESSTLSVAGTTTLTFKDVSATAFTAPTFYVPSSALVTNIDQTPINWDLGPYGYKAAEVAGNFNLTLGTAFTAGGVHYLIGYCTSPQ